MDSGYVAVVTPPHGTAERWVSGQPRPASELVGILLARGCHQTDIGDAFYQASPNWLAKA